MKASAFKPTLEQYFRTFSPNGLSYQSSWIWANVRDGEGQRYCFVREWRTDYSNMVVTSKVVEDISKSSPRLYDRLYMGIINHRLHSGNGEGSIEISSFMGEPTFTIEIRPQVYEWSEAGGEVQLSFRALGPALRYDCPGELEQAYYTSEFSRIEGAVQGKKVTGYGGMDQAWGSPGVGWLQSKIYSMLEQYWIVFVNRFADGSHEYGVMLNGIDRFSLAFLVRGGSPEISNEAGITFENTEDGFPKYGEVRLGKRTYDFRTTARISRVKGFMLWAQGEVTDPKETREVEERFAWMEFFTQLPWEERKK